MTQFSGSMTFVDMLLDPSINAGVAPKTDTSSTIDFGKVGFKAITQCSAAI
jgi:hypothetical protein